MDPTLFEEKDAEALSEQELDQRREMQIYSMLDYQPFYNHYVQDVLKLNQDVTHDLNQKGIRLPVRTVAVG